MKVIYNTYPMAFHTPGGGEMQLAAYARYLKQGGHEITHFNLWEPEFLQHDLVHFFSVMGGSSPFCRFVKQLQLPLIISSSLWITDATKSLYPSGEIADLLHMADCVITNSHLESEALSKVFHLPMEKFSVVYNGIDEVFFDAVDPLVFKHKFNIDYPFVLNVANVEPRKNQLNLIHAMKRYPDLKLINIGHVRDEAYAKRCFEAGSDQFVHVGALPHDSEELRSAYAACELFALPSTLETPGLAALEAAALGAKLLVTGVGSTREYFGDAVCYVEDPSSVDEIERGLACGLSQVADFALSSMIRQKFAWKETIKQLLVAYESLVSEQTGVMA